MGKVTANGHSSSPLRSSRSLSAYETMVRSLSDRLVEAQRPLRILDAIQWDESIERAFFERNGRELPPVTRDYYHNRPLPFDADAKTQEFHDLERDIRRRLGALNAAGQIMTRMCEEYREVVGLLQSRGTPEFGHISERLYGSSADSFHAGDPTLSDLGRIVSDLLDNLAKDASFSPEEETLDAPGAVAMLSSRLAEYFGDPSAVRVKLSDGLLADAAAGCDYLKIRRDARFTPREVRLLEVHEGWVHLGTTVNGQRQPVCTFLSKGPPASTVTQEGLAVLTEVLAFASHPERVRRLTHRIEGVALAESGANFLEVYRFFVAEGYEPRESYQLTVRVYRGSLPQGAGPFTKDLCYGRGFVQVYNYLRLAVARGQVRRVPLLFCGKTALGDMKSLAHLVDEGLVEQPRFVPPQFSDLRALTAWMCFAGFLNRLSPERIQGDYAALF